ncbi:hypothetical protein FN846DRAFT_964090 [Sphaerosporella brunnea]|uniref:Uncharacterized protein n=1 Tax=Sphaerosporella brunnea TaxID=1250544 RepID=A0A5J5ELR7_9PEZI|nr:hypothetical protein FN846DRAFT_964090 [Sphaerosporella brunnea]
MEFLDHIPIFLLQPKAHSPASIWRVFLLQLEHINGICVPDIDVGLLIDGNIQPAARPACPAGDMRPVGTIWTCLSKRNDNTSICQFASHCLAEIYLFASSCLHPTVEGLWREGWIHHNGTAIHTSPRSLPASTFKRAIECIWLQGPGGRSCTSIHKCKYELWVVLRPVSIYGCASLPVGGIYPPSLYPREKLLLQKEGWGGGCIATPPPSRHSSDCLHEGVMSQRVAATYLGT